MKKYSYLIVFLLLALFVVQAGYYIGEKSPAHDDTNWLTVAWYITHYWTWQGDYHVLMHPPLSFYMHGIPLRLLEWWQQRSSITPTPPEGTLAAQFPYPYSAILKYDTVFTIAKISMLPWMLLLGWYIYRWATQLYGMYAGLFALSLYVFNPFLIAYSTILSTDMTIVCFTFLATYYFWRFCQDPSYQRAFVSGITVGLALLARASGVLLFPIFCILGLILWLYRQYSRKHSTALDGEVQTLACEVLQKQTKVCTPKRIILSVIIILCIALFVLEAGFLFDMQPVRAFRPEQRADLIYRVFKDIPIPFGAYINGIRLHQSFVFWMVRKYSFAGKVWNAPLWYYNFCALLLRNPVAMFVLLLLSLFGWKGRFRRFVRDEMFLVVPAIFIFLYFSFFFPVNDFRFVLPAYPFLFVLMSRIVTWSIFKRTSARIILTTLVVWYVLSAAAAFPHYFAYCNELIGGMKNVTQWFEIDSGQDLKGLGRYMQKHHIPFVKLAYHGKAIPEYYGVHYVPLLEPDGCHPTKGLIAIGTTRLMGVNEKNHACYNWLKQYEPIDKIGYTIFIYSIP